MEFRELRLESARLIESDIFSDERGSFCRLSCEREFIDAGLPGRFVQTNLSKNRHIGTLRGLHFQLPPSQEGKLVRCIQGRILDVIVDLRYDSTTYLEHCAIELCGGDSLAVFIPTGFAHGFQTLTDGSDVLYQMTDYYAPELAAGLRWNDPALGITWPIESPIMNERDRTYPDLDEECIRTFARV